MLRYTLIAITSLLMSSASYADEIREWVWGTSTPGSGSGGAVSLYEARSGNEAALQTALTSTYGVLGLSLVEVTDAQDAFTTTADEICYTGTGGDLLLQASFSFSRQSGAGTVHDLSFAVDKTGAIGAADVVGDEQSRTVGSTDVGMGSLQATATFATDDCVSVLAKVNTTSTIQIEGFSISITAPSVAGVGGGTKRAGGAVVRVNSADIWDFGNSNVLDPATGTLTLGTPGAAIITTPEAGTGQVWRLCEGVEVSPDCHTVQAPAAFDAATTCTIAADGTSSGACLWPTSAASSDSLMVALSDFQTFEHQTILAEIGYFPVPFAGTEEVVGTAIDMDPSPFCTEAGQPNYGETCVTTPVDVVNCPGATNTCAAHPSVRFSEVGEYQIEMDIGLVWGDLASESPPLSFADLICVQYYLEPSDAATYPTVEGKATFGNPISQVTASTPANRRARQWRPTLTAHVDVTTAPTTYWLYSTGCGGATVAPSHRLQAASTTLRARKVD